MKCTTPPFNIKRNSFPLLGILVFSLCLSACGNSTIKPTSVEWIRDEGMQDSIFSNLVSITNNTIPEKQRKDSLAFLILPVHASCPYCRNKTIDSIVKHQDEHLNNRFIVISANGGRKTINSYFRENDKELPDIENKLFLDSTNRAYRFKLFDDKPTIYYTFNYRAYKKVASIPSTIKEDLHNFFSFH